MRLHLLFSFLCCFFPALALGEHLSIGLPFGPGKIDAPQVELVDRLVMNNIAYPLLFGERLELASSISIDEELISLTLNPDATFPNGEKLWGTDVVYSLGLTSHPSLRNASLVQEKAYVHSKRAANLLRIPFRGEAASVLHALSAVPVLQERLARQMGVDIGDHTFAPYLGPFVLKSNLPDEGVELQRNRHFYRPGYPRVDTVHFKILDTAAEALTALRVGGVHIIILPTHALLESVREDPTLLILPSPLSSHRQEKKWRLQREYWSLPSDKADRLVTESIVIRRSLKYDERFTENFDLSGCYLP